MFQNNLKIAFRSLLRRRTFTAINITGLALGMTAAIFAFLWVQNEMSFDSYHQNVDTIYRVNNDWEFENGDKWQIASTPLPIVDLIREEVPGALRIGALMENRWRPFSLKKDAVILKGKKYTFVNEDWFDMFDHELLGGTTTGFQEHINSAIITRGFAEKLLGEWDVVGETFQIDDTEIIVKAVIENHPPNSSFSYDMVLPLSYYLAKPENRANETWNNANFLTFVELYPNSNPVEFGEKLTTAVNAQVAEEGQTYTLQALPNLHFDEDRSAEAMATANAQITYIIGFIGFIILFLACVNYVSLTTAQAGMRTKEVGIRKIIGADGKAVFNRFFSESLIMMVVALTIALSIVQLTIPYFNNFTEKSFQLDLTNPAISLVCIGTLLTTLLLSGIYPALFLTGFAPQQFLSGQNFLKMKNTTFRKGLVVSQFAITIVLIIGTMIIFQQRTYIQQKELGYDKSHVFELVIPYNKNRQTTIKAIQNSLASTTAILGTATANGSIVNMISSTTRPLDWEGKPEGVSRPRVGQFSIDADFGELMQLTLSDGRWFLPNSDLDEYNVILNETAIKKLGIPAPVVGRRFKFHQTEGQIVGVVKDFHYQSFHKTIEPLVFYTNTRSHGNILIKTKEGKITEAIATAKKAWETHNPDKPFDYQFMDNSFDQLYKSEQKNASLFQLLAILAIFISSLGLFGLAVFSTEQRAKEIGVRKVLGASVAGIVSLLSKDFLKLIIIALLIACPLAYYTMEAWLTNYAYRIDIEVGVFLIASLLTISVALLTVGIQSIKAAVANPVKTLRSE